MGELKNIFSKIDSFRNEMVEMQRELTSRPALSPENGGDGEYRKAQYLYDMLSKISNNISWVGIKDERVKSKERPNLIAKIEGKNPERTIWVITHMDVVPPGDYNLWKNKNPWEVLEEDGKLYGRGVEDDQQELVASYFAVKALVEENLTPRYNIALVFVADEETGSNYGLKALIKDDYLDFGRDDLIIVPDGGNSDGTMIEVAEKSILRTKLVVNGKQTHASTPNNGLNANVVASDLTLKLYNSLKRRFSKRNNLFTPPESTFEPTKRERNVEAVNIIPGREVLYFDSRILPSYNLKDIENEILRVCSELEKKYSSGKAKCKIDVEFSMERQAAPPTDPNSEVVKELSKAIKFVYNVDPKPMGIGGGTVAAFVRKQNLEAVVWSRILETAHQINEHIIVDNMVNDAKVYTALFLGME